MTIDLDEIEARANAWAEEHYLDRSDAWVSDTTANLIQAVRELREALKFYGDLKTWKSVTIQDLPTMSTREDIEVTDPYEDYHNRQGGKKARAVLEKWGLK